MITLSRGFFAQDAVTFRIFERLTLFIGHFEVSRINSEVEFGFRIFDKVEGDAGIILFVEIGNHGLSEEGLVLKNSPDSVGLFVIQSQFKGDILIF